MSVRKIVSWWTFVVPGVAAVALALSWGRQISSVWLVILALLLVGAVLAAVHHAEAIAHHVGEPFGSLILAVAVTIIEVSLIVMLMIGGKGSAQTLARDSIFAVVMMTTCGIVGLCLLTAARRDHHAHFNAEGTGSALAAVILLVGLTLILPDFTQSEASGVFSFSQLIFVGVMSLTIYALFVFTQTVRHRDVFLPVEIDKGKRTIAEEIAEGAGAETETEEEAQAEGNGDGAHSHKLTTGALIASLALLLVALVDVVGLAKVESPGIESLVVRFDLPPAIVGVIIALIILLPETIAALKAARRGHTQTSLNLAYGSAMASIGLTIPVLALASHWLPGVLFLGLDPVHIVLFAMAAVISILTIVRGRANILQGGLHLMLFAAFLLLT
ncbi:MAG: ionic transporter y4hA, partial [Actinomycetia bacterium]|nr:ionic transporter y4hA [Actinomycetes bacterium]